MRSGSMGGSTRAGRLARKVWVAAWSAGPPLASGGASGAGGGPTAAAGGAGGSPTGDADAGGDDAGLLFFASAGHAKQTAIKAHAPPRMRSPFTRYSRGNHVESNDTASPTASG